MITIYNASKMVEFGSKLARKHGFKNLEYGLGDIQGPPIAKGTVHLAIFRQALHHALRPERTLAATHRMLKKNGRVVILGFARASFRRSARTLRGSLAWVQRSATTPTSRKKGFRKIEVSVVSGEK